MPGRATLLVARYGEQNMILALDAGGRTLAILASGLDIIYPADNTGLARRIVESGQGALITEFPLGVKPDMRNFPARNRIISGMSLGVLITEAPQNKGATQYQEGCNIPQTLDHVLFSRQ